MDANQATAVADALGGDPWQSGGGVWLVVKHRQDGKLIVFSDDLVAQYDSEDDFDACNASASVMLV